MVGGRNKERHRQVEFIVQVGEQMKKSNTVDAMEDLQSKHTAYQLFEEYIEKELHIKLSTRNDYRFIIGESPYPNVTNVILPYPAGIYQTEGIPEVAFLSSNWTIDVILVCGILFGSIDKSTKFIDWLKPKGIKPIALFGEFLFEKCKILIINRYDLTATGLKNRNKLVSKLVNKFNPTKILVMGTKTTKKFDKIVRHAAINVFHPTGANAYFHTNGWLKTYFLDSKVASVVPQLQDFKI